MKTSEKRKGERQMVLYVLNVYLYIFYTALCMYRIFLYGSSLLFSFCINKIKMLHFWRFCRLRKGLGSCCIEYTHGQITVPCILEKKNREAQAFCLPCASLLFCCFYLLSAKLPVPDIFDNILGGGAGAAVFPDLLFHFLQGIHHRGMVPAAEFLSDGGGRKLGDLPDYIHSHLPGL